MSFELDTILMVKVNFELGVKFETESETFNSLNLPFEYTALIQEVENGTVCFSELCVEAVLEETDTLILSTEDSWSNSVLALNEELKDLVLSLLIKNKICTLAINPTNQTTNQS